MLVGHVALQAGEQFAFLWISSGEEPSAEHPLEEALAEIFRFLRRLPTAADECVDGIPAVLAELLQRGPRAGGLLVHGTADHAPLSLNERGVSRGRHQP